MSMDKNRGFSLIELIIVMAIMAVLLGVSWYGINSLSGKQVSECVNNLETYLGKTRTYTLAFEDGKVWMEFSRRADGYYITSYRGGTADATLKAGNPSLAVSYFTDGGAKVDMAVGTTLTLSFRRESGAFQPISGGSYCNKIEVSKGGKKTSLILVSATGKYYAE